jgi:hypothetical protein
VELRCGLILVARFAEMSDKGKIPRGRSNFALGGEPLLELSVTLKGDPGFADDWWITDIGH